MNDLLISFAKGLDAVEADFLGATTHHGARIATLCIAMGKHLCMTDAQLSTLASCALMHDNALTEYILSERPGDSQAANMKSHCIIGQCNIQAIPFLSDPTGLIVYHHECADGSGVFGLTEADIPVGATLIAIADQLDVAVQLQTVSNADLPALRERIAQASGTQYTTTAAQAMLAVLDEAMLSSLKDENITQTINAAMPHWTEDMRPDEIVRLSEFAARIIDYKSVFTRLHSVQVANIAWLLANHYGFDEERRAKLYLAGALHDIGKLYIPTTILEKPNYLTDAEFSIIKTHIDWTSALLSTVDGFDDIWEWATNHHEKLDGSGYSRGLRADALCLESRLLICADIYQAISAERPYHAARSHAETIDILHEMVEQSLADLEIVEAMDEVLKDYPNEEVPPPAW